MNQDFFCNRKGEPVFLTGLQCHNSSSGTDMIDTAIQAVHLYGGNLLEAPVYWCEVEKEQDCYDMAMAAELVDKARKAGLYLLVLWFGASKNGLFTYAPDYIKKHTDLYKRAKNSSRIPVESLSPHCRETLERDKKAFSHLTQFLAEYDTEGTVIAIQVENEVGLVHTDRDYSDEAEREFRQPVPAYLRDIRLEDSGLETMQNDNAPSWIGFFGRHANEAFTAWKHACYIQEMAEEGQKHFSVPYIMNVSIEVNEQEVPGMNYISGGPVARVLDIWKRTAPAIKLFGPDIYLAAERDYRNACERYVRPDNPLFIPESLHGGIGAAMNMMLAAADYNAIGICCFGAESGIENGRLLPEAEHTAVSMRAIASLAPLLIKYHGTGRIHAVTQAEFSSWQYVKTEDYHIVAHFLSNGCQSQHYFGSRINLAAPEHASLLTDRGRCLIVDCKEGEFYLAGIGVCITFIRRPDPTDEIPYAHMTSALAGQLNFLSVEEGHFEGENWVCEYRRNGDEANYGLYIHPGCVVRVRLNTEINWNE